MSGPIYVNKDDELERERLDGTPRRERLVWSTSDTDEAWWEDTADAVPVVRMGGLSPAYYITDDPTEADAWLIEVKPKEM